MSGNNQADILYFNMKVFIKNNVFFFVFLFLFFSSTRSWCVASHYSTSSLDVTCTMISFLHFCLSMAKDLCIFPRLYLSALVYGSACIQGIGYAYKQAHSQDHCFFFCFCFFFVLCLFVFSFCVCFFFFFFFFWGGASKKMNLLEPKSGFLKPNPPIQKPYV